MTTEEFAIRVLPDKLTPIGQIPNNIPPVLENLLKRCFTINPNQRPDFQEIFDVMSTIPPSK